MKSRVREQLLDLAHLAQLIKPRSAAAINCEVKRQTSVTGSENVVHRDMEVAVFVFRYCRKGSVRFSNFCNHGQLNCLNEHLQQQNIIDRKVVLSDK